MRLLTSQFISGCLLELFVNRVFPDGHTQRDTGQVGPIPNHALHPTPTHYPSVCTFARRVRHIKCCSKPTSVEWCGGGVGYQALKQRVCIGADLRRLRLVST